MLFVYIFWDDRLIFLISGSNEQLQQQLEYTLLKPDRHSWWISKIQWGHLHERYAIKFCFKLAKNATETYGMLQTAFRPSYMNRVLSDIRDSKKAGSLGWMMRGMGGVMEVSTQELIGQRGRFRVRVICWGFKGVQQEIPSEYARTLQIGPVAFPPGQCTSPQLHPCHKLFDQNGHQDSSSPSL